MTESVVRPAEAAVDLPTPVPAQAHGLRLRASLPWRLTQLIADYATVFLAASATYAVYLLSGVGRSHYLPEFYTGLNLGLAALTVFALHAAGAYRGQFGLLRIESVRRVLLSVTWGVSLILVLTFFLRTASFSRLTVLATGPVVIVALVAQRFVLWKLQARARQARGRVTPVLVYGAGDTGRVLAQHLLDEHALGLRAVGFLDDRPNVHGDMIRVGPGVQGEKVPVLGGEDEIDEAIQNTGAAAVLLAMPSANSDRIAKLVAKLESRGLPFFFIPSAGDLLFSTLRFGQLAGMPVFTRRQVEAERFYAFSKRVIDILGAFTALLLTAPVLVVSTVLVKLSSPGPVFFRQDRVGYRGRSFTILKLRTMRVDAPRYAPHPDSPTDPRITSIGRWLRRLSIDELPQLWNVLRGEMSLVGPRPEMPFVVAEYSDIERQRLTVKPGVTGLWQISADRAFRIHDNIQYDLYYIENRTLSLDLAILLVTPFVVLTRNGAT
jgi:exopolysaccharide biosynthesis polyprenyl glycosylphosphotransferase